VLITGDWHSTFVNDIKRDFSDPDSAAIASEFAGTSISSNGDRSPPSSWRTADRGL
jgi:alkaline phosphatase D